MRDKKIIAILCAAFVALTVASGELFRSSVGFGAISAEEEGGHNFATLGWSSDANNHWRPCQNEGCTEQGNPEAHQEGEWITNLDENICQLKCDVCGWVLKEKPISGENTGSSSSSTEPPVSGENTSSSDSTVQPPVSGENTSSSDSTVQPPVSGENTSSSDNTTEPPVSGENTSSSDSTVQPPVSGENTSSSDNTTEPPVSGENTSSSDSTVQPPVSGENTSSSDSTVQPPVSGENTGSSDSTVQPPVSGENTSSSDNTTEPPVSGENTSSSDNTTEPPVSDNTGNNNSNGNSGSSSTTTSSSTTEKPQPIKATVSSDDAETAAKIPAADKVKSVTVTADSSLKDSKGNSINPANVKVGATEIFSPNTLKKVRTALGTGISDNTHINILDLTLRAGSTDISTGYDGFVSVTIAIPTGHKGKNFKLYRLVEKGGEMTAILVDGKLTDDGYTAYLGQFGLYALVAED